MSIIINPAEVRKQSSKDTKKAALPNVGFGDYLYAASGSAAATVAETSKDYQSAAVTHAAITGVAGVPGAMQGGAANAPYYGGTSLYTATPFGSGGYSYGGTPYAGGYGSGYGSGYDSGLGFAPSQDYLEKQHLFNSMNDANWEMLTAQITTNDLARDFQARSNILKTKSDTELNAIRNMRA